MDLQKPLQQKQKHFWRRKNRKNKEEICQQKETGMGGKIEMVKEQSKRQSEKLVDSNQQFGEQLSPDEVEVIAPECAHIPPESRKTHCDNLVHSDCSLRTSSNRCDKQIPPSTPDNLSKEMVGCCCLFSINYPSPCSNFMSTEPLCQLCIHWTRYL